MATGSRRHSAKPPAGTAGYRDSSPAVFSNRRTVVIAACLAAALLAAPLAAAPVAHAGGDEPVITPTTSPPGPWDDDGSGGDTAYGPLTAARCEPMREEQRGPATILGITVDHTTCAVGTRLVRRYQDCLASERGRAGDCYARIDRRCIQPEFLGRCRAHDHFYRRVVDGFRCLERRLYRIGKRYDATVTCTDGRRRVDHRYTLYGGRSIAVRNEWALRAAWANPRITRIRVTRDIVLRACRLGDPIRESAGPVRLDGQGHTLRQGCFETRLLRQDGTGFVELRNVTLTRGGSDGPGAAVTTRGEIRVVDSRVVENLSEEPGGGVMSQRRATIIRSVITGNLANDDGGGVYARRGGIQVYDSTISSNLVDGSGGALGSTGDILVVRSHIDGNTTDGDGGAIYTDEDGDVTVIDSTVDGSTADGPGGAIFTLDGDVTIIRSTLNGNRADDRGGAISGEADVTIVDSTIARNAAVAHVGGGVWARGRLYIANSTIADNYAEGNGGGVLGAGVVTLVHATILDNVSPVSANVGAGERLEAFASVIGPARTGPIGAYAQPTALSCHAGSSRSYGYNVVYDASCDLDGPGDVIKGGEPLLAPLGDFGGLGETRMPQPGSLALDLIPPAACTPPLLGWIDEGEQHLDGLVEDRATLLAHDQRGVARPQGAGCEAGAVEVVP